MNTNESGINSQIDSFKPGLSADMTVLEIVSRYRLTEAVFKSWDDRAGECICCNALFETVGQVVKKYGLDLKVLLEELETAAHAPPSTTKQNESNEMTVNNHSETPLRLTKTVKGAG